MFMLAAQVDHGANARRELADARDGTINFDTATTIGRYATDNTESLGIIHALEKSPFHYKARLALAHARRVRTFSHKKLQSGEQRGLAGTGLAGQNGKTAAGDKARLSNKGEVLYANLINHDASLRKTRGKRKRRSSPDRNRAAAYQTEHVIPRRARFRLQAPGIDHRPR